MKYAKNIPDRVIRNAERVLNSNPRPKKRKSYQRVLDVVDVGLSYRLVRVRGTEEYELISHEKYNHLFLR